MPPPPKYSSKKVANSLVAMSSAAIMAVYSAGYTRTRDAARRMEAQSNARIPAPAAGGRAAAAHPVAIAAGVLIPRTPGAPVEEPTPVKAAASAPKPAPSPAGTAPVALPEPPSVPAPAVSGPAADPLPALASAVVAPPPPVVAPAPPAAPPAPKWKDGTFTGWGSSRHGDIQAAVKIENGQILSATISQCLTRYSCSVIDRLPPEVPQRQSPEVDYVSGATQSANAFYYAVVDALNKAK
jgi:uncharacterized protein with FMN-binding domain